MPPTGKMMTNPTNEATQKTVSTSPSTEQANQPANPQTSSNTTQRTYVSPTKTTVKGGAYVPGVYQEWTQPGQAPKTNKEAWGRVISNVVAQPFTLSNIGSSLKHGGRKEVYITDPAIANGRTIPTLQTPEEYGVSRAVQAEENLYFKGTQTGDYTDLFKVQPPPKSTSNTGGGSGGLNLGDLFDFWNHTGLGSLTSPLGGASIWIIVAVIVVVVIIALLLK